MKSEMRLSGIETMKPRTARSAIAAAVRARDEPSAVRVIEGAPIEGGDAREGFVEDIATSEPSCAEVRGILRREEMGRPSRGSEMRALGDRAALGQADNW